MSREDIIRMAREARLAEHTHPYQLWSASDDGLERFATIIAAAEREACAKVAEDGRFLHDDSPEAKFGKACAAAIRARGQG